jgi:predicted phage tail protein
MKRLIAAWRAAVAQLERIEAGVREHSLGLTENRERLGDVEGRLAQLQERFDKAQEGTETHRDALELVEGAVEKLRRHLKGLRNEVRSGEKRGREQAEAGFEEVSRRVNRTLGRLNRIHSALSRLDSVLDAGEDEQFAEIARPLVESRRTMLGYDRLFGLWQAARNAAAIDGAAAEVGTFRGGSAALLARALQMFSGREREIHVVDTFEGHLDATFSEHDDEVQRGKFQETEFAEVSTFLADYPGTHVYMGDGPTVIGDWPGRCYNLVHLDVDLYQPTIDCLRYFAPRVPAGGIIVVDDYEAPACPGISVAVHEFLDGEPGFQTWRLRAEQIVLVKR